ncbi:hypothetical protein MNEG_1706 [Monoraphidium neglectum]|uniref:Uncharacterized protein n=1 Tax=Monoraphidium neglectum TaxID=145388 RepID=A0A0D2MUN4_9CHLO|nr:hypothetical protein MNEG_1706 [Monoraphidium neglectum]KIZ06245.1 hypothetical protein MNEG_1706 [Monoraphidium neglectum]|eukprot:XP_013905264.1 hypothetical protein MNEG_1706 [Monoraphidium neglectum]
MVAGAARPARTGFEAGVFAAAGAAACAAAALAFFVLLAFACLCGCFCGGACAMSTARMPAARRLRSRWCARVGGGGAAAARVRRIAAPAAIRGTLGRVRLRGVC